MPSQSKPARKRSAGSSQSFRAKLWLFQGGGAWYFVTLPKDLAAEIRFFAVGPKRGFGSVRVEATIGDSTWRTSVFPSKSSGTYVLPVKADVRRAEGLQEGRMVRVALTFERHSV